MTVRLKPHIGLSGVPFINTIKGLNLTRLSINLYAGDSIADDVEVKARFKQHSNVILLLRGV